MAQAHRKVWLEPEETTESTPVRVPARARRRAPVAIWRRTLVAVAFVTVWVAGVMFYVHCYACIASAEAELRTLKQDYARLQSDCIMLDLEQDRLSAKPRIIKAAIAQGLEVPPMERVHYIQVAEVPMATEDTALMQVKRPIWPLRLMNLAVQRLSCVPTEHMHD